MSDQQLVTGFAILISGYYQFESGLSSYHWQMVTTLAWFSSATHIATLICLEQYFQKHRYVWYARLVLMAGLVIMLAVGVLPSGNSFYFWTPASCFYKPGYFKPGIITITSEIMLLGSFMVRAIQMFSRSREFCDSFFKTAGRLWRGALACLCRKLQRSPLLVQAIFLPGVFISLVVFATMQCLLDFARSHFSAVCDLIHSPTIMFWQMIDLVVISLIYMGMHSAVLYSQIGGENWWYARRKHLGIWSTGVSFVASRPYPFDVWGILRWASNRLA